MDSDSSPAQLTIGGFAGATAVEPISAQRYRGRIEDGWDVGGRSNGGYLLAMTARALCLATGRRDPLSITAHYLRPGSPGPVEISTEVVRAGRTISTARATLGAEEPLLAVLGSFTDRADGVGRVEYSAAVPPDLPAPERCVSLPSPPGPRLVERLDLRLHPEDAGFGLGRPSGEPRMRGWLRLRDEPHDSLVLPLAVDAFPPTVFNAGLPLGWSPTLELTVHVRAVPVPGWLRCAFVTRFITAGFLEVDGEVWDEDDRLVAQSRQLAMLPRG